MVSYGAVVCVSMLHAGIFWWSLLGTIGLFVLTVLIVVALVGREGDSLFATGFVTAVGLYGICLALTSRSMPTRFAD